MRIQDLLQTLATTGNPGNSLDNTDTALVPVVANNVDDTEADVMIPPLQAKLELLKRATDVPNVYDDLAPEGDDCGCDSDTVDYADEEGDELEGIRRLAGVPVTAIFTAADDEPFEG